MNKSRLKQALVEYLYSRKAIRASVKNDLMSQEISLDKAKEALTAYLEGDYYESKNNRLEDVKFSLVEDSSEEGMTLEGIILDALIACAINDEEQPIQSVAARLARSLPSLNSIDAIKTASEILIVLAIADYLDVITAKNSSTGSITIRSKIKVSDSTRESINNSMYLPPMVCKPNKVFKISDRSHLTYEDSLILGEENQHEGFICVDNINLANRVALSLDKNVLMFHEVPNKDLDTPEKVKQFALMKSKSEKVYQEILDLGNKFYFTWKYDFRGRQYSQGYHINIQSTQYKKALINLHKKEVITL